MSRTTTVGTRNRFLLHAAALALLVIATSCGREKERTVTEVRFPGTTLRIEVGDRFQEQLMRASGLAQNTLDELRRNFDETDPDSEINRINQHAWHVELPIDTSTYQILHHAKRLNTLTGGAFDISTGPIAQAWGLRGDEPPEDIPEALVDTIRFSFGMDKITLREFSVQLRYEANAIDLRPMLDGYLTDRTLRRLRDNLIDDFRITAGPVTRVWGEAAPGRRWSVPVPDPSKPEVILGQLRLASGRACAVAHAYEGGRVFKGKRLSTVIDPIRGRPVEGTLLAVALAPTATDAQALAVAGLVVGPKGAMEMLAQLDRAELMLIPETAEAPMLYSPGFSDAFEVTPAFAARMQPLPAAPAKPAKPANDGTSTNAVPAVVTEAR
jgi:FAD:protein FMN transferase